MRPLQIAVSRLSDTQTSKEIAEILGRILAGLGWHDTWEFLVVGKSGKGISGKFEAIQQNRKNIVVRVRTDNGCWEGHLTPPKSLSIGHVFGRLRSKEQRRVQDEYLKLLAFDTDTDSEVPETSDHEEPKMNTNLDILNPYTRDVGKNKRILDLALLSLETHFDKKGEIKRRDAVKALDKELNLSGFVKSSIQYSSIPRLCGVIMHGLREEKYVTPNFSQKLFEQSKATITHFTLTPLGKTRINYLKNQETKELLDFRKSTPAVEIEPAEQVIIDKIDELQPILDNYDRVEKEVKEAESEIRKCELRLSEIQGKILELSKEYQTLQNDRNTYVAAKDDGEKSLDLLRQQLTDMVNVD